ncbi:MAG: Leucine Rich repeats (2 copies) [Chloroflexi bacterium ADurb.Bin360]|nr:MAG: Leucine Rich repeats (2 copies) [Chloroflexi bacterium ADurb.Bin360]
MEPEIVPVLEPEPSSPPAEDSAALVHVPSPKIEPPVLFSTWKMKILVRSYTASNTEWVEECEMPPAFLPMPDEDLGIRPVGLNHTQIELWAHSFRMPELICHLDLSDRSLFDSNLGHLTVFTHLKELNLGKTLISGEGLAGLKDLPLTWLRLDACKNLSDRGLQSTGALVHLETLDLSRCTGITGRGLSHPEPLAHLRVLNLEGCSTLQEEALAALAVMPALEDLDLSETQISGTGFLYFRNNHTLRTLSLEGCARFKSQTVPHLLNLEALEVLHLGRTSIEDADLEQLQVLRNLRELHLYGCAKVTADKVAKLKARGLRVFHDSDAVILE